MSRRRRRVFLIQVRDDPRAEHQERLCFLESTGLAADELDSINLVAEPRIAWRAVRHADAVMIGGAGSHTVTCEYPFTRSLQELVLRLVEERRPLFGSCWGHHFLVVALGGLVVTDHHAGEVGTFDVQLTAAGRRDPLFIGVPGRFAVQLGHHDRVDRLRGDWQELAFSERCRFQAIRLRHRPVYGTQFHSELSREHMEARLMMYRDTYLSERTAPEELSEMLRSSPCAELLLRRFLGLYT